MVSKGWKYIMNILFFIGSVFPFGSAWASRGRGFAKLFKSLGHKVHIIANYTYESGYIPGEIVELEGITYQALRTKPNKFDRIYISLLGLLEIKKYINSNKVDLVVTSSIPQIFTQLRYYLNSQGIPLYLEQCEWFDPLNFKIGKFDPHYKSLVNNIEHNFEKSDGIIAISSFFENHYNKKGANVIRIPTILDTTEIEFSNQNKNLDGLRLVFAGNIGGKKELLYPIFKALELLKDTSKIKFDIFGPTKREILRNIDNDNSLIEGLKETLVIHGRVPQQAVNEKLRNSDFMIFIRPDRRSSNAGFPTKFAESMAVGTPVITNLTSDIGMYLNDGQNGFVVRDTSVVAMVNVLKRAIALTESEKIRLRSNARITAEVNFDYKNYKSIMKQFLKK